MQALAEAAGKFVFFIGLIVLNIAAILTWVERKQSAVMQDRIGANRATIFGIRMLGMFHMLADMLKLFTKEFFIPMGARRFVYLLAPMISLLFALVGFAAIPFGDTLILGGREIPLQIANVNIGILYIFAVLGMAVYGVVLGAWASNNNYALLGGLRASAQMLSYEVAIGVSLVGVIMVYQTVDLMEIARAQGQLLWGWLPQWGILLQPLGFLIFMTAGIAETKRIPFDAPEGESEIVGYFIEYSGMGFGMYFLTDFLETILIASLTVTFFLGGFQVPYLYADGFHFPWGQAILLPNIAVAALQFLSFLIKLIVLLFIMMAIRWTLPRFRYDQIMHLGWKILLPASLINILITAVVLTIIG
ncbi:MAG: NADH-quinone oxidoreductase subunit H [candidate division KSB1 bacterium]|nr:NADH-quinone oxidoreductase subunit H [candidate division KSB1 bacterium]